MIEDRHNEGEDAGGCIYTQTKVCLYIICCLNFTPTGFYSRQSLKDNFHKRFLFASCLIHKCSIFKVFSKIYFTWALRVKMFHLFSRMPVMFHPFLVMINQNGPQGMGKPFSQLKVRSL